MISLTSMWNAQGRWGRHQGRERPCERIHFCRVPCRCLWQDRGRGGPWFPTLCFNLPLIKVTKVGLDCECLGGGRIQHKEADKYIKVILLSSANFANFPTRCMVTRWGLGRRTIRKLWRFWRDDILNIQLTGLTKAIDCIWSSDFSLWLNETEYPMLMWWFGVSTIFTKCLLAIEQLTCQSL